MKLKKINHLQNIITALEKMSDEKYDHVKNWKYLQFSKDGDYVGISHFKMDFPGTPFSQEEPITYLPPMLSKEVIINSLRSKIISLTQGEPLEEKKGYISQHEVEEYIFGPNADILNRLSRFYEIAPKIRPEHFWLTFRSAYDVAAKKYFYRNELRETFTSNLPHKNTLMVSAEKSIMNNLDHQVTIYRAMSGKEGDLEDYGLSWTLDREIAAEIGEFHFKDIWKASRFFIKTLKVNKSDIYAFFNNRNIFEVVYVQKKEEIPAKALLMALLSK